MGKIHVFLVGAFFWMSGLYSAQERRWRPCDLVLGNPHQNVLSLHVSTSGVEVKEKCDQKRDIIHALRTRDDKKVPSLTETAVPQEIKALEEGYTAGQCLMSGDETYCIVAWLLPNRTLAKIVSYTRLQRDDAAHLARDLAQLSLDNGSTDCSSPR